MTHCVKVKEYVLSTKGLQMKKYKPNATLPWMVLSGDLHGFLETIFWNTMLFHCFIWRFEI